MIELLEKDIPLLLEIVKSSEDCLINHKVSKRQLKRLIDEGLIEVETRKMSTWSVSGPGPEAFWISNGCPGWEKGARGRRQAPTSDEIQHAKWTLSAADGREKLHRKNRTWFDRVEVHARLTNLGSQWWFQFQQKDSGER